MVKEKVKTISSKMLTNKVSHTHDLTGNSKKQNGWKFKHKKFLFKHYLSRVHTFKSLSACLQKMTQGTTHEALSTTLPKHHN